MSKAAKLVLKNAKGTRDFNPQEMSIRNKLFNFIRSIFVKHGALEIDTPVMELSSILKDKYGEDSKLIYDLQDQGGEILSLRYDLTVPFARYLAMNKSIQNFKRFQISKVYRRDNISISKGRLREFYQCDFDICGLYDPMIADSLALKVLYEIINGLPLGPFQIKVNHRLILDGMFRVCGVPEEKIRSISSAVDKLDKVAWPEIYSEMVNEKGLEPEVASKIEEFVKLKGSKELIDKLLTTSLSKDAEALKGIEDMRLLFLYLDSFGITENILFDLSLARGLDYYTGLVYEAVFINPSKENEGVGSIAAGGRYDKLVGMFSGNDVPCVGLSIGVERIYSILIKSQEAKNDISVYVTSPDGHLAERMAICKQLWDAGISADFTMKIMPKLRAQLSSCDKGKVPFCIVVGAREIEAGVVKVKIMKDNEEIEVRRDDLVSFLSEKIVKDDLPVWDRNSLS